MLAVTSELPFNQRNETDDPEETEHDAMAAPLYSRRGVWIVVTVTLETGSVDERINILCSLQPRTYCIQ